MELAEGPQIDSGTVILFLLGVLVTALLVSALAGTLAAAVGVVLGRWLTPDRRRTRRSPTGLLVVAALTPLGVWVVLFGLACQADLGIGRPAAIAVWAAGPFVASAWGAWNGARHTYRDGSAPPPRPAPPAPPPSDGTTGGAEP